MKILYYSSSPILSSTLQAGAGTHIREMIAAMKALGHEVLPVIMGDVTSEQNMPTSSSPSHTSINWVKKIKKFVPPFVWRSIKDYKLMRFDKYAEKIVSNKISVFKPDLIYERANYLQLSGIIAAKRHNVKHFMEINAPFKEEVAMFENASSVFRKRIKDFERKIIESPSKVFVVSSALKDYYKKNTAEESKIIVTPNCINIANVIVDPILKEKLTKKYNLDGFTVIGFVGSMFAYHGVDILIKSFAMFQAVNPAAVLLIVGDGHIVPGLKQLAAELNISRKVIFTGSVNHKEVFTYIDLMDITVLAKSNWYGSPIKIFEYGIMNKAIISFNSVAVQDVMEHNVDGLLINASEDELCRSLTLLVNDKNMRTRMAAHFKEKILTRHTWKHNVDVVLTS